VLDLGSPYVGYGDSRREGLHVLEPRNHGFYKRKDNLIQVYPQQLCCEGYENNKKGPFLSKILQKFNSIDMYELSMCILCLKQNIFISCAPSLHDSMFGQIKMCNSRNKQIHGNKQ
jgi:hypothetical protein